eukprot:6195253-Pleurochrysis_carterae.AAC.3
MKTVRQTVPSHATDLALEVGNRLSATSRLKRKELLRGGMALKTNASDWSPQDAPDERNGQRAGKSMRKVPTAPHTPERTTKHKIQG